VEEASDYGIMEELENCLDQLLGEVQDGEDEKEEEEEEDKENKEKEDDVQEVKTGDAHDTIVVQTPGAADDTLPALQEEHDQKLDVQLEVLPASSQSSLSLQDSATHGQESHSTGKTPLLDGVSSSSPRIAKISLSNGGSGLAPRQLEVVDLTEIGSDDEGPVRRKLRT